MGMGIRFKLIIGDWCEAMFARFPFTNMEAAFGRLHNSGAGAFGARPTIVDSMCVNGKLANIASHQSPMINLKHIPIPIHRFS